MAEGTTLNPGSGGDGVSDEDVTGNPRLGGVVPSVPVPPGNATTMKVTRSKQVVSQLPGNTGRDDGDASPDNPLAVDAAWMRSLQEMALSMLGLGGELVSRGKGGPAPGSMGGTIIPIADLIAEVITTLQRKQLNVAQRSTSSQHTTSAASTTLVTLLLGNPLRQGVIIVNDVTVTSAGNLYILLYDGTTTLSTSSYSVRLAPGDYFELPFGFLGRIDAIWDSSTGTVQVTELINVG